MNFNHDFDRKYKRSSSKFRTLAVLIFLVFFAFLIFNITFVSKSKSAGKSIYMITVHNFRSEDSYTSDSIVSQDVNRIVFFDMFGLRRTVTGSNITVTQF